MYNHCWFEKRVQWDQTFSSARSIEQIIVLLRQGKYHKCLHLKSNELFHVTTWMSNIEGRPSSNRTRGLFNSWIAMYLECWCCLAEDRFSLIVLTISRFLKTHKRNYSRFTYFRHIGYKLLLNIYFAHAKEGHRSKIRRWISRHNNTLFSRQQLRALSNRELFVNENNVHQSRIYEILYRWFL